MSGKHNGFFAHLLFFAGLGATNFLEILTDLSVRKLTSNLKVLLHLFF
jgi:hypothetical protein